MSAQIPKVEISRRGRQWSGWRTLQDPEVPLLAACVSPPLTAWSQRGIERKARRWIARVERDNAAPHFTIGGDK